MDQSTIDEFNEKRYNFFLTVLNSAIHKVESQLQAEKIRTNELESQNTELTSKNEALESRVNHLENKIGQLENSINILLSKI